MPTIKYRIRKWLKKAFTHHLENCILDLSKDAARQSHLAHYWEQVARGKQEMPVENDDIQHIAGRVYYEHIMANAGRNITRNIENNFMVKL